MAFKLRYKIAIQIDTMLLNKRLMLCIAVLAPCVFIIGSMYLGGMFEPTNNPFYKYYRHDLLRKVETVVESTRSMEDGSVFAQNLKPIYTKPVKLTSEAINMDLNVEEVGVDTVGQLQTPSNWGIAGWFKYGPKAGEPGNVIINAHFDDSAGRPAAFWQLKSLKQGDTVILLDKYGKSYAYSVKDSFLVGITDPNRLEYFENDTGEHLLTLVTCGGVWLPGKATYDKRLIVTASLVTQ